MVTASVREEDKLCNKTSCALDYLLRYKHFSYILEALKNLGKAFCCLLVSPHAEYKNGKMVLNSIFPASHPTALDVATYVTLNSLMTISLAHPTTALNKRHASYSLLSLRSDIIFN